MTLLKNPYGIFGKIEVMQLINRHLKTSSNDRLASPHLQIVLDQLEEVNSNYVKLAEQVSEIENCNKAVKSSAISMNII